MRSALNSVFNWAISKGKVPLNPVKNIRIKFNSEEKRPEILTLSEIHTLLSQARALNDPWYYVWALALLTGMRNGELHALKWSKVDFENGLIYIEENYNTKERKTKPTKGGYWRQIGIEAPLMKLLKELKLQTGNTSFVLPRFKDWDKGYQAKILRRFCKQIGIPPVKFHTLRACFATHLLNSGTNQAQVQKICGWKDSETMDRYVRLSGIDIKGATRNLPILPPDQVMGKVVDFLPRKGR